MQNQENILAHVKQEAVQLSHLASWEAAQNQQSPSAAESMQLQLNHEHHAAVSLLQQLRQAQTELQSWHGEASNVSRAIQVGLMK